MHTYVVSITAKRGKVNIIKLIRAITGWGLKHSKDYVEDHFCFDEWMTDWCTFDVTIGTVQFAALAHYVANRRASGRYCDCEILDSNIVEPKEPDPFDLTCA